ncbi:hypothetical protein EDF62_1427 [Leucobacter luti]|uniref:CHAP domain-containing protein n=1 Tax=Leucobacter luti TaxID=340320 RepID=A0A4V3CYA4_9MICO|nr:CHAP domain-containing protein [Leucobacter luti]TDP93448.1 hypothetical protein EDF62_1427 [Leucobacter luti]
MAKDLDAYIAAVRGQFIDVDAVFGAQCWDQFSHYAMWLGVPAWPTYTNAGGTSPHGGYACNVHHNAASAGLNEWFEILPATVTPRRGDVVFWDYGSAWYPSSHVATVLEVLSGHRMLRCLTQNPGAVQIADLITDGIVGYLRPRIAIAGLPSAHKTPKLAASKRIQELEMANHYIAKTEAGRQINAIFNTQSGFFHEFESRDGEYNTNIARTFGVKDPTSLVSVSHYDAVKRDAATLRAGKA